MKTEDVVTHITDSGNKVVLSVGEDNRLYVNGRAVVTELQLAKLTNVAVVMGGLATAALCALEFYKEFVK